MFSVVSVCPCVRLCVCLSVSLSVQTITFEPLHIGTSFLVWRYILTISRSSLNIKVIGSRSRSCAKNDYLLISTCYCFVCTYRPLIRTRSHIKVKVTHQGQGHTSRSRSNQGQHQIEVIFKERYSYVGGLHLNQMRSCFLMFLCFFPTLFHAKLFYSCNYSLYQIVLIFPHSFVDGSCDWTRNGSFKSAGRENCSGTPITLCCQLRRNSTPREEHHNRIWRNLCSCIEERVQNICLYSWYCVPR